MSRFPSFFETRCGNKLVWAAGFALLFFQLKTPQMLAADWEPANQRFRQEVAHHYSEPKDAVQLLDMSPEGVVRCLSNGKWYVFESGRFALEKRLEAMEDREFWFMGESSQPIKVPVTWR